MLYVCYINYVCFQNKHTWEKGILNEVAQLQMTEISKHSQVLFKLCAVTLCQ